MIVTLLLIYTGFCFAAWITALGLIGIFYINRSYEEECKDKKIQ